jgi:hypothetical protein
LDFSQVFRLGPRVFFVFLFQEPRQLETANVGATMIRPPQKLIRTSAAHPLKINTPDLCGGDRMPARRANGV